MRTALHGNPNHDYQVQRHNTEWPIHILRTYATGGLIAWTEADVICDPACGDGSLIEAAHRLRPIRMAYLGDISIPSIYGLNVSYPHRAEVNDAADTLLNTPDVDLVLLTEFLEHIPDPDAMLRLARRKAAMLIASSPLGEGEGNAEHLWSWNADDYQQMLIDAGWTRIMNGIRIQMEGFTFQIYAAK